MNLDKKFKQLRALKSYDKFSDSELREKIKEKKEKDLGIVLKSKKEQKLANDLVTRYFEDFTIQTISDKNTLKELIYLEIIQVRLHDKLNSMYDTAKAVPTAMLDVIQKNSKAIIDLKTTLGLNRKNEEKKSSYDALQHLQERAKVWREKNVGSRTMVCPHCSKMILMKIRVDKYDAQKHPHFEDKVLFNKHLVFLYLTKKITRKDISLILECSEDYTDWMVKKIWKTNSKYETISLKVEEANKEKLETPELEKPPIIILEEGGLEPKNTNNIAKIDILENNAAQGPANEI